MKFLTNKKLIQKITIVMVFLILFNFIVPSYSKAAGIEDIGELLVTGIEHLVLAIGDGVINLLQKIFIGTDAIWTKEDQIKSAGLMTTGGVIADNLTSKPSIESVISSIFGGFVGGTAYKIVDIIQDVQENKEKIADYKDIYEIAMSPEKIFSGTINALNIDFLSSPDDNSTEGDTNIEWLNSYKNALNKLQTDINALKDKDNLSDSEKLELEAKIYVWLIAGGNLSDDEIINKVKVWYGGMDNSYSDARFEKFWFTDSWFANEENKDYGNEILNVVRNSGIEQAVSSAGSDPNGFSSAISWAANEKNSPANVLHDIIATWYKIMRNIALIVMLIILVYVGIRIMLSSTASDNTKYRKMLMDWVVAICILFVLHYIMAFTVNITQLVTNAFTTISDPTVADDIMNSVRESASEAKPSQFGYVILYLVLIIYTIYFLWYYVKRVVYAAFLTLIAPLVAITYPLDKMGDSKSQAFDMWLREYILNIVIQPVHLIIYTVMVTSALTLAVNNPVYAVVVIGAMIPAENFIKEMFGLNTQKGPKGGLAAAALTMSALSKLANRKPPKFGHNEGGGEGGSADKEEKIKKPRMEDKFSELSNSWTGNNEDTEDKENPLDLKDNAEDDNNYINYGNYETSRDNNQINGDNENNTIKDNALKGLLGNKTDETENPINQKEESNNNALEGAKKLERKSATKVPDINNLKIAPLNAKNSKNTKANSDKDKKKAQKRQLRYRKRAARKAVNKHYRSRDLKMLRKMGRGAVRTALGVVGAGTAATLGLAAGIATGDVSKAVQYTAAGALAGSQIGKNVGNGIANLAGGASDFVKSEIEANKIYKNELYKNDKEYQKAQYAKQNRKESRSSDTKAAIRAHFGYGLTDTDNMNKAMTFVETAKNKGMEDLDKILNAYGLTQGIDSEGNSIGTQLDEDQALVAGLMAEKYDVDNESGRKAAKSSLKLQLADNIYSNSNGEISEADSVTLGKEKAKEVMKYVDIAQGIKVKDAGKADIQEALQDAKDDAKRAKEFKEQAEIQAKIKAEAEAKADAKAKAKEKAEAERKAKEKAEADRKAKEKAEADRKAKEEADRKAKEEAAKQQGFSSVEDYERYLRDIEEIEKYRNNANK